jgi:hypothetical protein
MRKSIISIAIVVLIASLIGSSEILASNQNSPSPTATPDPDRDHLSLDLEDREDSEDSELDEAMATIEALQATVEAQATTIAELESATAPSPTPTTEPAPQVDTEPVDLGSGIFLYSYLLIATDDGGSYIAADLVNSSGSAIVTPGLTAAYFDADGALLGEDSLLTFISWADVDSHIPYSTSSVLDDAYDVAEIDRVEFSINLNTFTNYSEVDASNLEVVGVPLEGPDEGASGRIQNNGSEPVEDITILYTVYDAGGYIVGSCFSYLDIAIPPGKSAKFSVSGSCLNISYAEDHTIGGKPFSYRLMVSL